MDVGGYSATGPREANEDNFYVIDFSEVRSFRNGMNAFILVSDGMGGYLGGDVASLNTVTKAQNYIDYLRDLDADLDTTNQIELDAPLALTEIAQNAHDAILAEAKERGNGSMGATYVAAFLSDTHAWIGHIGDSRAYLIRDGVATQLTEDHSQVGRMLARGLITEEEAQNHPARNRIERALGFSDDVTPEMDELDLLPGDMVMLCSDGVYTVLNAGMIASCVHGAPTAGKAAEQLVKAALRHDTDDNATAVVAIIGGRETESVPAGRVSPPTVEMAPIAPAMPTTSRAPTLVMPSAARLPVERLSSRESQGGGRAYQRGPRSIWLPIAIVLAIIIVILLILIGTGVLSFGAGGTTTTTPATDSAIVEEESVTPDPILTPPAAPEGFAPYVVTSTGSSDGEAVLKYIDNEGMAQRFWDEAQQENLNVPVQDGSVVDASTNAQNYGRSYSYRVLSKSYLDDLKNDLATYNQQVKNGNASDIQFRGSELAEIMTNRNYLRLLEGLSASDFSLSSVSMLALNADCLEPEEPSGWQV